MTDNDKSFFHILKVTSEGNRKSPPADRQTMKVSKQSLSEEALDLLDFEADDVGGWYGNVYIEFIPLVMFAKALPWQNGEEDPVA